MKEITAIFLPENSVQMSEDLISNNFVDNVNRTTIKQTFRLTKSIFNLVIIYTILDLIDWYISISNSWGHVYKLNSTFYSYRIHPLIAIILLTISIIGTSWHIKANKLINLSFENADADIFNAAYQFNYKAAKLSMISICISVAYIVIKLLLKNS